MNQIENRVRQEKERILGIFGNQSHPSIDPLLVDRSAERIAENYEVPTENRAKQLVNINAERGTLTWAHILVEEVAEVIAAESDKDIIEELIQVCAISQCWIEAIQDGRSSLTTKHPKHKTNIEINQK